MNQLAGWEEPYSTISDMVKRYTGEEVNRGEPTTGALDKIKRCLEQMDKLIVEQTMPTPSNLIHPNERIRDIAKEKHDK